MYLKNTALTLLEFVLFHSYHTFMILLLNKEIAIYKFWKKLLLVREVNHSASYGLKEEINTNLKATLTLEELVILLF